MGKLLKLQISNAKFLIILIAIVVFATIAFYFLSLSSHQTRIQPARAQTALDTPTITAIAKGLNQINLQWPAVNNYGYGYKVEIQSNSDSRYSSWTEIKTLPYWVTESHYIDPQDDSACQYPVFGLRNNTEYNFRIRTYSEYTGITVYSSYSAIATATTRNYAIKHVSISGSDSNNGQSEATAWRHIYYAGQQATAGTVVIIHEGNYASDYLMPSNSGSSGINNKIVFMADSGETVMITSYGGASYNSMFEIARDYIVIDGIGSNVSGLTEPKVELSSSSDHCVLANMDISNGWLWMCLGSHNLFHNNYVHDTGSASGNGSSGSGIALYGTGADYNIVQYNTIRRCEHDTGLVKNGGDYNQWMNNVMDGGWGLGWEVVSDSGAACQYNLFEGNLVKDVATGFTSSVYKPGIEVSGNYNTVRRNLIINGNSHGIEISRISGYGANNNLIYNNIVYRNKEGGIWFMAGTNQENNKIANNIIYYNAENFNQYCAHCTINLRGTITGTELQNNLILYKSNGIENANSALIYRLPPDTCRTLSQAEISEPLIFHNNIVNTPSFIDEANFDFNLNANSSCIDGGVVINDPVWGTLSYKGSAPDIGAYEYVGQQPPPLTYLLPDLTKDRAINQSDFDLFKPLWGTSQADFNSDSKTDSKDFGIMMSKWGSY